MTHRIPVLTNSCAGFGQQPVKSRPHSPPFSARHSPRDPQLAQKIALQRYPDLGVAESALNKEFIARMKRYEIEKKEFFSEPDWPIRLAAERNEDLTAKKAEQ